MYLPFSYKKLWKLSIDKGLNKTQLRDRVGITSSTLSRLSKNKPVNMEILDRICNKFHCNLSDIVDHTDERNDKNQKKI